MNYNMRDIYPTLGNIETSTEAIPEPVEQEALHEDSNTAQKVNGHYASGKKILLSIGVLICIVVFLGGGK